MPRYESVDFEEKKAAVGTFARFAEDVASRVLAHMAPTFECVVAGASKVTGGGQELKIRKLQRWFEIVGLPVPEAPASVERSAHPTELPAAELQALIDRAGITQDEVIAYGQKVGWDRGTMVVWAIGRGAAA
jgi:hypothetical protein